MNRSRVAMHHARRFFSTGSFQNTYSTRTLQQHSFFTDRRKASILFPNSTTTLAPASFLARRHFASDNKPEVPEVIDTGKEWWESLRAMSADAIDATKLKPHLDQMLDPSSLYTMQGVLPTSIAVASCAAAWMVLPRVLRRLHRYVEQVPIRNTQPLDYQLSVWAALEDPTRLFITLVTFSQLAALIAPATMAAYLEQVSRGGLVVSFLWFLHRWKTVAFSRLLIGKSSTKEERERYLALDKVCSVGIIVLGASALAEASGVAVQSILTVGGIGGVATAFAARDILGNLLSGLTLQFFKPFSTGDFISAGNIEGQVTDMGLHSTSILNNDKFPVIVPNSFFSSQVIVNKSHASKQSLKSKIYIPFHDIDKLPDITVQVLELLKNHPKVMTEQDPPNCFLSKTSPSHLEITIAYDLPQLSKRETLALEQDILVKASGLVKRLGASLGAAA